MNNVTKFDYKPKAKELKAYIKTHRDSATILVHKNADGDCIGAGLALSLFLESEYEDIKVISQTRFSDSFSWLPNSPYRFHS